MFRLFPHNTEQLVHLKNKFKFYVHAYGVHLILHIVICTLQTQQYYCCWSFYVVKQSP